MPDIYNYDLTVEQDAQYDLEAEELTRADLDMDEKIEVEIISIPDLNTGKPVRFWFGTLAEYNALPVIYDDVCYNIEEASCYAHH